MKQNNATRETKDKQLFQEIEALYHSLANSLPSRVDPATTSTIAKIPFKAHSIREILFHRITEFPGVAIYLLRQHKLVSAFIIIRALVETVALFYLVYKKIQQVIDTKKVGKIDSFLMRVLFGSTASHPLPKPMRINEAIKELDKEYKGMHWFYNRLCEFAHPDWAGCAGAYGKMDYKELYLNLSQKREGIPVTIGLVPLKFSLEIFIDYYDDMADLLPKFAKICEEDIASSGNQQ